MNNAQKITLGIVAAGVVAVVVWLALRAKKADAATTTTTTPGTDGATTTGPAPVDPAVAAIAFPIKEGSRGDAVKELQRAANRYLAAHPVITQAHPDIVALAVDGIWGVKTAKALYYCFNVGEMGVLNIAQYDAVMGQSYS
ncbi:MAG: hypothetical protein LBF90_03285 [Prevotellaceae bacterium]|jgi:hypothetical protein|nr:hypothetical protein [Prevotellaceae bacterium]